VIYQRYTAKGCSSETTAYRPGKAVIDCKQRRETSVDGTRRADIRPGMRVSIVLKKDQRTGVLTEGIVKDILTGSPVHTHGIKVRLESGEVGRVRKIGE
jgi:uncharacterized repeat protein (TIGR03833 family)